MYRRDFLKLGSLLSMALLFPLNSSLQQMTKLPVEVQAHGKLYRGANNGNIEVSEDAGKTWRLHTGFGSQYNIMNLSVDSRARVVALIEFLGYDFRIALSGDSRAWRTM